jgi:hypothetical protein
MVCHLDRVAMLAVVGVLTVEAQGKGPWWEIPGNVRSVKPLSCLALILLMCTCSIQHLLDICELILFVSSFFSLLEVICIHDGLDMLCFHCLVVRAFQSCLRT